MTEAERLAKLEELLKLPNELEWLEFKTASNDFDFDKLGEYFSNHTIEFADAGHFVHAEVPEVAARTIRKFFERVGTRRAHFAY